MNGLHPALRTARDTAATHGVAGDRRDAGRRDDAPVQLGRLVVDLEILARHLRDANDMLGHRASGLSFAAAARTLDDDVLAQVTRVVRHGIGEHPVPHGIRVARTALRDAALELRELSRCALDLVPPDAAEQQRLDLRLCGWVDAAHLLAGWVRERVGE